MSDYITGLRGDLVEAAARHQERSALRRRALPVLPKAWSRPALAAAAVAAACVAAIVIAVTTVGPPQPQPTKPHRVQVVRLGVEAFNATYGAGGLWVSGTNGEIVQVARGRVAQRLTLGDLGGGIATVGESVWTSAISAGQAAQGEAEATSGLVQVDGRSGAVVQRFSTHGNENGALEAGAGGLWLVPNTGQENRTIEHRDPVTGRLVGMVRGTSANDLEAGDAVLWALNYTGGLAQIDPASDRVVSVVPDVTRPSGVNNGATGMSLAAEGKAVWVAGGTRGDVVLVQAGRIARRLRVGEGSVDGVARTRNALWVTLARPGVGTRYSVIRIDPETGRQTGTVDLGHRQPTDLVPAGRDLWIVTLDGSATLIR